MGKRLRFLVTAGPTREPLDAVRFLSNRSSGRMGYAVARAAREGGHDVTLVSGPVAQAPPEGVDLYRVETAVEMAAAVWERLESCDCLVMAAAVADYAPENPSKGKQKKGEEDLVLRLRRTPDILLEASRRKGSRIFVGFAVESENLLERARGKLERKNLDLIVANDVGAFATADSTAHLVPAEGAVETFLQRPKEEIARAIVAWVEAHPAGR
jgi:phosphopantothenoylcysteine decarboxylase/phosphopantothenate--cysteine ligase